MDPRHRGVVDPQGPVTARQINPQLQSIPDSGRWVRMVQPVAKMASRRPVCSQKVSAFTGRKSTRQDTSVLGDTDEPFVVCLALLMCKA